MSQHSRIAFDEILQFANDDRMSHVARMLHIRKICVREIERHEAALQRPAEKRGPGRPRKEESTSGVAGGESPGGESPGDAG